MQPLKPLFHVLIQLGILICIHFPGQAHSWEKITAGGNFVLAISEDETLWGWGSNAFGQFGDSTNIGFYNYPLKLSDEQWTDVSAGGLHAIALKNDGTIWGWGYNEFGQTGTGKDTIMVWYPVQIGNDDDWKAIGTGTNFSFGIKEDGTLWSWGENTEGSLGDGSNEDSDTLVQVGNDADWLMVEGGGLHALGIKEDSSLWAWGWNGNGQLGDETLVHRHEPVRIGNSNDWAGIAAGFEYSMGLKQDGTLYGWGWNSAGQLGLEAGGLEHHSPQQLEGEWQQVTAGMAHTVAQDSEGRIRAWGWNSEGQLGDSSNTNRSTPVLVTDHNEWKDISAGTGIEVGEGSFLGVFTIAITEAGALCGTGMNAVGMLGDSTYESRNYYKCIPSIEDHDPPNSLRIASNSNHQGTFIYPNPFTDRVSVITEKQEFTLSIYNPAGEEIKTITVTNKEEAKNIDLSNLEAGRYIVHISGGQYKTQKMLIKR